VSMETYIRTKTEELLGDIRMQIAVANSMHAVNPDITVYVNATAASLLRGTCSYPKVAIPNINVEGDIKVFGYTGWIISNNTHPLFRIAVEPKE